LKTSDANKAPFLPYTVADLMRMSRASQPIFKEKPSFDPASLDRYYSVSANPVFTYSAKGRKATRQKNLIGSQVDVRA